MNPSGWRGSRASTSSCMRRMMCSSRCSERRRSTPAEPVNGMQSCSGARWPRSRPRSASGTAIARPSSWSTSWATSVSASPPRVATFSYEVVRASSRSCPARTRFMSAAQPVAGAPGPPAGHQREGQRRAELRGASAVLSASTPLDSTAAVRSRLSWTAAPSYAACRRLRGDQAIASRATVRSAARGTERRRASSVAGRRAQQDPAERRCGADHPLRVGVSEGARPGVRTGGTGGTSWMRRSVRRTVLRDVLPTCVRSVMACGRRSGVAPCRRRLARGGRRRPVARMPAAALRR